MARAGRHVAPGARGAGGHVPARPFRSPGTKGTVDELIVALGSAGALTAAVECFRAWLQRDKSRSIDVRWDEDGGERHVTFSGDNVDAATVQEIARAAAARVGGPAWPADTEPS